MNPINQIIATNLSTIRKEKKLSLDKMAELTGVSKGMISQIEKGESSPTIATLWKIANSLRLSLSELLSPQPLQVELVAFEQIAMLADPEAGMKIYPLFQFDSERRFEVFNAILEPGHTHTSAPHEISSEEYLLVNAGQLTIRIENTIYELTAGDALRFEANKPHAYINNSDSPSSFNNIIYYSRN